MSWISEKEKLISRIEREIKKSNAKEVSQRLGFPYWKLVRFFNGQRDLRLSELDYLERKLTCHQNQDLTGQ